VDAGYRPPLLEGWRRWVGAPDDAVRPADEDALEVELLSALGTLRPRALVPLPWERFAGAVLVPQARDLAGAAELRGRTLADLPVAAAETDEFALGCALLVALADAGWEIEAPLGEPVEARNGDAGLRPFAVPGTLEDPSDAQAWIEFAETAGIAGLRLDPATPLRGEALELETLLAAPAAVPPDATLELALTGPRSLRTRAIVVVVVSCFLGAPLAVLMTVEALTLDLPPGGRAFMLAMALALAFALIAWSRLRVRLAGAWGRLRLDGERLVIQHPVLLRRPYVVPRALVRTVVLDAGPERRDELARRVSLPVAGGWLWTAGLLPVVPLLAVEPCVPSLALVFEHPIGGPDVRRVRANGPLPGEGITGLLLTATPTPETQDALERLGFPAALTAADAERLLGAYAAA
jgi:hypothetical protein